MSWKIAELALNNNRSLAPIVYMEHKLEALLGIFEVTLGPFLQLPHNDRIKSCQYL
jgi:hypothetical protein